MRLRIPAAGLCLGTALGLGAFAACGAQTRGPGGAADAGPTDASDAGEAIADVGSMDAAADAPMEAEAGPCTGVICAGQCTQASDCRSCSGAPLLCGATGNCVSACGGCQDAHDAAMPIDCFACDNNQQNPIGTCQPADAGSYCLNGDYVGQYQGGTGYQCGCKAASDCPGASQVCVALGHFDAGFCLTCGEATIGRIQGQPCKDGGTCQESQALCQ